VVQNQTIIGLHLPRHVELGQRRLRGILDYADQHPAVTLADFCFTQDTPVPPGVPPWTGKVDGVVMGVSYDRRNMTWIECGRVPTVNTGSDLMDTKIPSVFADPKSLAQTAVEHLHGIGYCNL
jgi:hypothetical protein